MRWSDADKNFTLSRKWSRNIVQACTSSRGFRYIRIFLQRFSQKCKTDFGVQWANETLPFNPIWIVSTVSRDHNYEIKITETGSTVGAFKIILTEEPRFPLDWLQSCDQSLKYYTDKKENKIFLIYKEIQKGSVAKPYITNSLFGTATKRSITQRLYHKT